MAIKRSLSAFCGLVITLLIGLPVRAEVKIIEAESTYIMGDNDSKIDARRIAIQEAKRKALELAGTYVESLTVVKNYQLSKDEIKSYTAGILETEVAAEQMRGTTEHPEIYIEARCKVDTDVLASRIKTFRESEELKDQLNAAARENEDLRKERDALVKQLAADKDKTKASATRQKLDTVLAKEEANDEAHKVWINIGSQLDQADDGSREIKQADLDNSAAVLQKAIKVNPQNQRARYMLASIYQRKGNISAAEDVLRTALKRAPSNIDLHMKLGILLKDQGRYPAALQEFHFVERARPHNPMMLFYSGMTFKQMGQCGRTVPYLHGFLKDQRINQYPQKKHIAIQAIKECDGDRPGRPPRRVKDQGRQ
jgi:tetratricopeptide (TPR) repeat protein